ncbi:hypothetical protein AXF42_Ash013672 [Apostasia shenzhenica]|uniref:Uncharacterized protein n=1 Tax=Apostasia shenzhenica TaxID=1088818 RepID=A0A2I0APN0_9ASPA|nr:hypothetical protein AXF42_Ash013672 [Apostasia shenzhenica]
MPEEWVIMLLLVLSESLRIIFLCWQNQKFKLLKFKFWVEELVFLIVLLLLTVLSGFVGKDDWECDVVTDCQQAVFMRIKNTDEKYGGNVPNFDNMEDFNKAIMEAGLEDAGYSGKKFTWANSNFDRALINGRWISYFEVTSVSHLEWICSDRAPILVECLSAPTLSMRRTTRFDGAILVERHR